MLKKIKSLQSYFLAKLPKHYEKYVIALSILYPFMLATRIIVDGNIPFWYDPARDFLLALENLKKLTLIGPPSGIPGIFYGAYWIWMLSTGLIFSRDPRFVVFLISLLPYFTVFPFVLFKFAPIYGKKITILLWLLFILAFQTYAIYPWNPHVAPVLFLLLAYLLLSFPTTVVNKRSLLIAVAAGIASGLTLTFHISFGLGVFLGSLAYLCLLTFLDLKKVRKKIRNYLLYRLGLLLLFVGGFLIALSPYVIFELRHNFLQTRALMTTLSNAVLYNSASVGQTGLTLQEILSQLFIGRAAQFFNIPSDYILPLYALVAAIIIYQVLRKRITLTEKERNIVLYVGTCFLTLLWLYASSKNPVWHYHFIGVEILVLLLTGIVLKKSELLRKGAIVWVGVLLIASFVSLVTPSTVNPLTISGLGTKKYIAERIYQDTSTEPFAVLTYSPAIYTYDFDYLIKWLGEDVYHKTPVTDIENAHFVYLIIPKTSDAVKLDFINWKTPNEKYSTVDTWSIPDGTQIIKRKALPN